MIALAEGPNEISFALPGVDAFLLKSSLISRVREMVALAGSKHPMHRALQADLGRTAFFLDVDRQEVALTRAESTC